MKMKQTSNNKPITELTLDVTNVFDRNYDAYFEQKKKFIINIGGTRSSKSYSIAQLIIYICITQPKTTCLVVRKSFPSLRASSYKDFLDQLRDLGIYTEAHHDKSNNIYSFPNGSSIQFLSIDNEEKVKGRKSDVLFINEATELSHTEFNQLMMRCTGSAFIDLNPSEMEHWTDKLIEHPKAILIKSTYKDNHYLSQEQIDYIEGLINMDYNMYKIYCLGEKPVSNSKIYSHIKKYVDAPASDNYCYGLDLGYNDPCVLVKTTFLTDGKVYVEELLYESKLTTSDLIEKLKILIPNKTKVIYCDHRPDVLEEIRRAGFNIKNAVKGINEGINFVKQSEVYVHIDSLNGWREINLYSWKTKGEQILDEVVDMNNHFCDSMRYSIYSNKKSKKTFSMNYSFG